MAAQVYNVGYDFSNGEVAIDIVEMVGTELVILAQLPIAYGVEEVNYTPSIEREKMYGTARNPLARTEGQADYEASVTMLMYWWHYTRDILRDLGKGLFNIELNIHYSLFKGGNVPLHTDLLYRCAIKSPESAFKRGPENLMIPIELDPMNIYYDGVDGFGVPLV